LRYGALLARFLGLARFDDRSVEATLAPPASTTEIADGESRAISRRTPNTYEGKPQADAARSPLSTPLSQRTSISPPLKEQRQPNILDHRACAVQIPLRHARSLVESLDPPGYKNVYLPWRPAEGRARGRSPLRARRRPGKAAQTNLGFFYFEVRGGLPKDRREAARLFRLAADQGWAPPLDVLEQSRLPRSVRSRGSGIPQLS
jgi:hypothetical protein